MTVDFLLGVYLGGYGVALMKLKDDKELSILSATVVLLWPVGIVCVTIEFLSNLIKNLKTKI